MIQPDPTTQLIAACCIWPQTARRAGTLHDLSTRITDWSDVARGIRRHRVSLLVHRAFAAHPDLAVPTELRQTLETDTRHQRMLILKRAVETTRLCAMLTDAGIPVLELKGLTLEARAYGTLGLKFSRDIDLYVSTGQATQAIQCLEEDGYRFYTTGTPTTPRLRAAIIRNTKDISLIGPAGIIVELHWRIAELHGLIDDGPGALFETAQEVRIGDVGTARTLGDDLLFPYLCVHGAHHDWARLKWLADAMALWRALPADAQDRILTQSDQTPAAPALRQTLTLGERLMELPAQDRPNLPTRQARALQAAALHGTTAPAISDLTNPLERTRRLITSKWAQRHLYPSRWHMLAALWEQRIVLPDIVMLPLPAALNWLYLVIRVPAFGLRQIQKLIRYRASKAP